MTGKVIRFDEVRGYGFISPDNDSEDVFVHANDLLDGKALFRPGLHVAFEVEVSERGLKASDVRMVEPGGTAETAPGSLAPGIQVSGPAARTAIGNDDSDDGLCDLLSWDELQHELTEALLVGVPSMTSVQMRQARHQIINLARAHNWIES